MAKRPYDDELDEGPSEEDMERFGGATRTCPECRTELYDDADVCWKCGHALMSRTREHKPWAIVVAGLIVVGLLAGYVWWMFR